MIVTAFKAVMVTVVLVGAWLAIQRLWTRIHGRPCSDPLAGRLGCQNCHCDPEQEQHITDRSVH